MPQSVIFENIVQGIWLAYQQGKEVLYDAQEKQIYLLPDGPRFRTVFRANEQGKYYLTTDKNEVYIYDRYGRTSGQIVEQSLLDDKKITWKA